jgi:hypothetical protein
VPKDYFGPVFPYDEATHRDPFHEYRYMGQHCQNFHFNMTEFFGYDERRILAHIEAHGKLAIRQQNQKNLEMKNRLLEFLRTGQEFYLKTKEEVQIRELRGNSLLAYHTVNAHTIFSEVTCTLLQEAKGGILFSSLLKRLQEIFEVDTSILKRDLQDVLPLLPILGFVEIDSLENRSI